MASTALFHDIQSTVALVKTLTNAQLKDILRNEGLAVSGVKASLQIRIIDHIDRLREGGNIDKYDSMKKFIYHTAHRSMPAPIIPQPSSNQQYQQPSASQSLPTQHRSSPMSMTVPSHVITPVREHTRDSVELKVVFTPRVASKLLADPNLRVMVFCAADTGLNQYTKSDIAFPHQVELKANLDEVKANLRGLKNKPGTTRPADITNYMRRKAGYQNTVVLTFALTQKRFFVLVNLVQRHPVEELVTELKRRKTISKEQVLREMRSKADDTEIVATSSVMSLKCPLSHTRIAVPCRSVICTHNQCFDASSFLQLQEQAPQWLCPVCSKATSFESLQIDQYVDDILQTTPLDVEQVIIEPDGKWSNPSFEGMKKAGQSTPTTNDDDDLIEIQEPGMVPIKQESLPAVNLTLQQTPHQSREHSTVSSTVPYVNKRPVAQVIDLTGSDNDDGVDDDLPVRPTKRPALGEIGRSLLHQDYHDSYSPGLIAGRNLTLSSPPSPGMSVESSDLLTNHAPESHPRLLGASCLDLLLIELVPMAERLTKELTTDDNALDDEEAREAMFFRLESLGYRVGQGLAERFARDRPRFVDNLDVIKFLCKDIWTVLFKKQVDNLKTNHRGVYVLTDNAFRPFSRMSTSVRSESVSMAQAYLWFPCGVIRGALSILGISTIVQAETAELPGATFQIKTVNQKS
ncbi:uncharacterized protein BP01DRAFT_371857 [Aspergillus saccharolyticus JOP 1030-1]|uniref:Transport protein particle component-domain-containing protein n=1 Tax=Aspergillus saccharolyticus JOP 1030-1 TaxID=1450539 RepID=A0A318ZL42_9EURO|nr:hypothetical protein BP01DRAFT_371857 [Aspergillus saccharolyticus JOP 1030-1]PYH48299.1 hypothetical protein BP01DRAFT_371857 [Aspergillus saccharolyticus JOP 1030-1]